VCVCVCVRVCVFVLNDGLLINRFVGPRFVCWSIHFNKVKDDVIQS